MNAITNVLIGIALAAFTIGIHLWLSPQQQLELSSILLVIIGSIYFGFALLGHHLKAQIIKILVASAFVTMGVFGLWFSPLFLIIGLYLHGVWDLLHHNQKLPLVQIPQWYIPFCASYDWIMATYLLWLYH
jgi:hypothetical protein